MSETFTIRVGAGRDAVIEDLTAIPARVPRTHEVAQVTAVFLERDTPCGRYVVSLIPVPLEEAGDLADLTFGGPKVMVTREGVRRGMPGTIIIEKRLTVRAFIAEEALDAFHLAEDWLADGSWHPSDFIEYRVRDGEIVSPPDIAVVSEPATKAARLAPRAPERFTVNCPDYGQAVTFNVRSGDALAVHRQTWECHWRAMGLRLVTQWCTCGERFEMPAWELAAALSAHRASSQCPHSTHSPHSAG